MANKKISELPNRPAPAGTDLVHLAAGGASYNALLSDIFSELGGGGGGGAIGTHDATGTPVIPNPDGLIKSSVGAEALVGSTWTADFQGAGTPASPQETTFQVQVFPGPTSSGGEFYIHGVYVAINFGDTVADIYNNIANLDYSSADVGITSVINEGTNIRIIYDAAEGVVDSLSGIIDGSGDGDPINITVAVPYVAPIPVASVQYQANDFTWDYSSSRVASIKLTEEFSIPLDGHFVAFTSHPANLSADLAEILAGTSPLTSNTDLFIQSRVYLDNTFFNGPLAVTTVYDQQQLVSIVVGTITNTIGAEVDFFYAIDSSGELRVSLRDVTTGLSAESLGLVIPVPVNPSSYPAATMVVGTLTSSDLTPSTPSFDIQYNGGSVYGDINVENFTVGRFERIGSLTYPAQPAEGLYRITGEGKVGDSNVGVDDIIRVYADTSIYKYGKGIEVFSENTVIGPLPTPIAPASGGSLVGKTWTSNFPGNNAGPVITYQTIDVDWNKVDSYRISLKQTELNPVGYGHFVALTTHPANVASDLLQLFIGPPLTSSTELFVLGAVADTGTGLNFSAGLLRGNITPPGGGGDGSLQSPSFGVAANSIGSTSEFYFYTGAGPNTLGTAAKNGATLGGGLGSVDISGVTSGTLKLVVGSLSVADAAPLSTTIDIDYLAGSTTLSPGDLGPFLTFQSVTTTPLQAGIYEADISRTLNNTRLKAGDVFTIGPDNDRVLNLSGETVQPNPSHILYTPNVADTLGTYGSVEEDRDPLKANSFEEAVRKSKTAGRIPIVIDTDVFLVAGQDATYPRIKSFETTTYTTYQLTNIKVYTRDAWINRDTVALNSLSDLAEETTILVDEGVKLQYGDESSFLPGGYTDNEFIFGGRQVEGWIGFSQFKTTNSVLVEETPDQLLYSKADHFINIVTNVTDYKVQKEQTFVLWAATLPQLGYSPIPGAVYLTSFISIEPRNVAALPFYDPLTVIDIRAREFSPSNQLSIKIIQNQAGDPLDNTGLQRIAIRAECQSSDAAFAVGQTEGASDSALSNNNHLSLDIGIDSFYNLGNSRSMEWSFEPVGNTIITVSDINTDNDLWNNVAPHYKYGTGRLHIYNFSGAAQTWNIESRCARSDSGITWASTETATVNIIHVDNTRAYANNNPVFANVELTGMLTQDVDNTSISNDNTQANAYLITGNMLLVSTLPGIDQSTRLPDDPIGKVIKVFNDENTNTLNVYPGLAAANNNLGLGVNTPDPLAANTWAEYTGISSTRYVKTNSGSI